MITIVTAQEIRSTLGDIRIKGATCTQWIDRAIAENLIANMTVPALGIVGLGGLHDLPAYGSHSRAGTWVRDRSAVELARPEGSGPFPCFNQFNTMAQVLDGNAVSWKIYATKVLHAGMWEPFEAIQYVRNGPDWSTNIIAPQTKILTDPGYGQLASVSWVTPSRPDSDHPQYDSDAGPSWVASVVNAIGESSYWQNSAIVVVWDDWGGFYDNASPPQLDYRGLGIRVPCIIISPYAKQNYVSHVQYEYGSILRFIEEVNNIPAGSIGETSAGYTDGRATSLDDAFDFTQQPRAFTPIGSKYPMSHFLREPPSNDPVDTE